VQRTFIKDDTLENLNYLKKKVAEFLWFEINSVAMNSDVVRSCARALKNLNMVDQISAHEFPIDLRKLLKAYSREKSTDEHEPHSQASQENGGGSELLEEYVRLERELEDMANLGSFNKITVEDENCKSDPIDEETYFRARGLTPNEALFQKYQATIFDEALWLKKACIRFK